MFLNIYKRGNHLLTTILTLTLILSLLFTCATSALAADTVTATPAATAAEPYFSDVTVTSPYFDAVQYAASKGIVLGAGSGCFRPDDYLTTAQLAIMLCRASCADVTSADSGYAALSQASIAYCVSRGWMSAPVSGTATHRFALVAILRAYGLLPDVCSIEPMNTAAGLGLCPVGTGAGTAMTRGEAVYAIYMAAAAAEKTPEGILAEYGLNIVNADGVAGAELAEYAAAVSFVPENIRKAFATNGWSLHISDAEISAYCTRLGNPNGTYSGITHYSQKLIVVNSPENLIHEFGHFLDYTLGFPAITRTLYASEKAAAETVVDRYAASGHLEFFAECFEYWITQRYDTDSIADFEAELPATSAYLAKLESGGWLAA